VIFNGLREGDTIYDLPLSSNIDIPEYVAITPGITSSGVPVPCPWYQAKNNATGKCEIGGSLLYGLIIGGAVLIVALKR
jgi:hypothetical protein